MTQRQPRLLDGKYLNWLRKKPCHLCGSGVAEAAHIRIGLTGMGRKPDDAKAVPLCRAHHRTGEGGIIAQHSMSEEAFWRMHGVDPFALASSYYAEFGGAGGKARKTRDIPARKPRHLRAKITSRNNLKRNARCL